jgi:ligand-binding SRPBCC domain-containing protein
MRRRTDWVGMLLLAVQVRKKGSNHMQIVIVETYVNSSIEKCFDAARDIDLHMRTVWPYTKEKAIAGVTQGLIELGETVTFRATHFGIRQSLTSKIIEFNRPYRFTDKMQRGAFKSMKHIHEFIEQGEGTLMKDTLEFQSPLGIIGTLVDIIVLKHYMKKFVNDRNIKLKAILEA